MKIHIVQKGDTLWKIAKKYGVNFEELKKMNSQLSNPDMIMPGMKVKVPTTGGLVKKEAPVGKPEAAINLGAKKEMPLVEHPFAKEKPIVKEMPIKEMPIKEVPIKEQPIIKEAPKVPYTPKMPLPVVPEIDINNYYMTNMTNMTVKPELPPKPANILPEIKEVPKKEVPVPPPVEAPVEQPCVPITPVMPGPGFCPPMEYYPQPYMMPYPQGGGYPGMHGGYPGMQGGYPGNPGGYPGAGAYPGAFPTPGMAPTVAGASFAPHFGDESSSFMPQMPVMNPGYNPSAVMGAQNPAPYPGGGYPQMLAGPAAPTGYPEGYPGAGAAGFPAGAAGYPVGPAGYPGAPAGYPGAPAGYPGTAAGYPGTPAGYEGYPGGMSGGYQGAPVGYPEAYPGGMPPGHQGGPAGYPEGYPGGMQAGYPQAGYPGGPQMGFPGEYPTAPGAVNPAAGGSPYGPGSPYGQTPYGYPPMGSAFETPEMTGAPGGIPARAGGDCGCGGPKEAVPNFVPTTPPIYSAPYTGPVNVAQPPYMNPYGIGPEGSGAYGMPRFDDESNGEN